LDKNKTNLPDWIIEELFDETNLYDPEYNKKYFRSTYISLGTKYQAEIPEFTEYTDWKPVK
jgi:hypothetical protein